MVIGNSELIYSQSKIHGVINKYAAVTSVGADYVIVDNAVQFNQFSAGDTVLLIQMKGIRTYVTDSFIFGTPEGFDGKPGQHEFLIVESLNEADRKISFCNNIQTSLFSSAGTLQIIKVPYYKNAIVDATLTCLQWDSISKIGGVLVAVFNQNISLNADIDVSGKGFKGGAINTGLNKCSETDKMYKYFYSATSDSAGFKGESQVSRGYMSPAIFPSIYPLYGKGKGANFSGGGGGDGRFSGGGGGANYGAGGTGGRETGCTINYFGGLGGYQIKGTYFALEKGIFLGSGGGSSTYVSGGTPSAGGNGGGIIILICDTLKGNGWSIRADGDTPILTASGSAGSGGGGAGGTIALYLQSFSTKPATSGITISVKGGNGGNNEGTFGEGGGGGGGLILTNNIPFPSNGIKVISGGDVGSRTGVSTGNSGSIGESLTTFIPNLNGFVTDVRNIEINRSLTLFPNPASEQLTVGLNDHTRGVIEIILFDHTGRKITSFLCRKDEEVINYNIPVSDLHPGLYHIRINLNKQPYGFGKVIVPE